LLPAQLEACVALFGVETYVGAAYVSLNTMAIETRAALAEATGDMMLLCSIEAQEAAQALRSWRFIASALELMAARPRPPGGVWLGTELSLMSEVKQMVERDAMASDHPVRARLLAAWGALLRVRSLSGGDRGFMARVVEVRRETDENNQAKVAAERRRPAARCARAPRRSAARARCIRRSSSCAPRARRWCTAARRTRRRIGLATRRRARRRARLRPRSQRAVRRAARPEELLRRTRSCACSMKPAQRLVV
jgi:hypothetical protein